MAIVFKDKFKDYIEILENESKFVLWCKLKKNCINSEKDLIIGCVYIPPEKSPYFSRNAFEEIETELVVFNINGNYSFCLCGDFNSRTGSLLDYIKQDNGDLRFNNDFEIDATKPMAFGINETRKNKDLKVNNSGYDLVDLCKGCSVYIMNGRCHGDLDGALLLKTRVLLTISWVLVIFLIT